MSGPAVPAYNTRCQELLARRQIFFSFDIILYKVPLLRVGMDGAGVPLPITVLAGISGMGKESLAEKIAEESGRPDQIMSIDFEKILMHVSESADIPTFLDIPSARTKARHIGDAFEILVKDIRGRKRGIGHVLLRMHLSYFKNSELLLYPVPQLLSTLSARVPSSSVNTVVLVDDVFAVWKRLRERADRAYPRTALRMREVMIWRSAEMSCAEMIPYYSDIMPGSQAGRAGAYPVSVRHPPSTFKNLIFEEYPSKVYLSYHITSARNDAERVAEINGFRRAVHRMGERTRSAVFDPVTIDELALAAALRESDGDTVSVEARHRWPLGEVAPLAGEPGWPISIPRREVEEVLAVLGNGHGPAQGDVENQITSRDYHLVELANYLAVYRPFMGRKRSRGVEAELLHAREHGRKALAYHPEGDRPEGEGATTHPFENKFEPVLAMEGFGGAWGKCSAYPAREKRAGRAWIKGRGRLAPA